MSNGTEDRVLRLLERTQAVKKGHYVYTSGKHGEDYVNVRRLFTSPRAGMTIGHFIALAYACEPIDVVVGPAKGAIALSQWVAYALGMMQEREIASVFAEKGDGGEFVFNNDFGELEVAGKRALVVEDVSTSRHGGSLAKTIIATRLAGGIVVGAGLVWNRSGITAADLDVPVLIALVNKQLPAWDAADCPLCRREAPINEDAGHGRALLARGTGAA